MKIGSKIGQTIDHYGIRTLNTMVKEYKPVYSAKVSKPTGLQKYAENWLAKEWVRLDLWQYTDHFLLLGSHTNDDFEALINWMNPGTLDASNINDPVHTPKQGLQYNGTDSYTDTNMNPSVNGVNYTQNSASQIIYIRTDIKTFSRHGIYGSADLKDCYIWPCRDLDPVFRAYISTNNNASIYNNNSNGSGLYINTRTAAAINKLYRNGTAIINGTAASTGVPAHNFYIGCYNDDDSPVGFRADQVFAHVLMKGLSQELAVKATNALNGCAKLLGVNVF